MKLSVIVPVYNGEKYLRKCLESIQNQEYADFEAVLIDDGSTDHSGEICDDMVCRDQRFRVFHKRNEGLVCARKDGIIDAKGEWIAFVDADDWIDKGFIGSLLGCVDGQGADVVAAGCTKEKGDKQEIVWNGVSSGIYCGEELQHTVFPKMLYQEGFFKFGILPYLWNKLFKRQLLARCYEDIDFRIYDGEDAAVVYPYLLSAKKIVVTEETGYHYRIHNKSMSAKKKDSYYENVSRLYLYLNRKFDETDYYNIMFPQLCQYMRMMVWQGGPESFIESQKYLFPFAKVPKGARVILYGAGYVGKSYCYQLNQVKYCYLTAWVDKKKSGTTIYGIPVRNIESIPMLTYDFIVVAVADKEVKEEIAEELRRKKVDMRKIIM